MISVDESVVDTLPQILSAKRSVHAGLASAHAAHNSAVGLQGSLDGCMTKKYVSTILVKTTKRKKKNTRLR